MLPRKVLIFESSDINNNTHFTLGNYNINDGGYDNDSVYNDVNKKKKGDLYQTRDKY